MPRSNLVPVLPRAIAGVCAALLAVGFSANPAGARDRKDRERAPKIEAIRKTQEAENIRPVEKQPNQIAPKREAPIRKARCNPPPRRPSPQVPGFDISVKPPPRPKPNPPPFPQRPKYHNTVIQEIFVWNSARATQATQYYPGEDRQDLPEVSTIHGTGKMSWAPWDFAELPCDYGERFVAPADKTCESASDCAILPVPWDCCGALFLAGVSRKELGRYVRMSFQCRPILEWCSCPPRKIHAEDGRSTEDPTVIRLECFRGMCTTSFLCLRHPP